MIRAVLVLSVVALALVGGCDDTAARTADAGVDNGACPSTPPAGTCNARATCSYPDAFCRCDTSFPQWFCAPAACSTAADGAPCSLVGMRCNLGFEYGFLCVGPENVWVLCGGVPICQSRTTGALCCGPGQCGFAPSCSCGIDGHVTCADADGGT